MFPRKIILKAGRSCILSLISLGSQGSSRLPCFCSSGSTEGSNGGDIHQHLTERVCKHLKKITIGPWFRVCRKLLTAVFLIYRIRLFQAGRISDPFEWHALLPAHDYIKDQKGGTFSLGTSVPVLAQDQRWNHPCFLPGSRKASEVCGLKS